MFWGGAVGVEIGDFDGGGGPWTAIVQGAQQFRSFGVIVRWCAPRMPRNAVTSWACGRI